MRIKHAATLLLTTTLLVTTVGATPSSGASSAPRPGCDRTVDIIDPPQISPPGAAIRPLADLSVASGDTVWFAYNQVGNYDASADPNDQPWPLRWDGRSVETAPPLPRPRSAAGSTFAHTATTTGGPPIISFDSADHGWLQTNVSPISTFGGQGVPSGYRWHQGRWTMVPLAVSPDPRLVVPNPADVASLSPDDAWSVGGLLHSQVDGQGQEGYHGAHIQHWDGTSWQTVGNPLADQRHTRLQELEAVSPTDIWAVGGRINLNREPVESVVMRWDGSEWSLVDTPAPSGSTLWHVSAAGPDDVWAVGTQSDDDGPAPLVMRWDGGDWTEVTDFPGSVAGDVYAASATDVWVIADQEFLHWDGSTWETVPIPRPELYGMRHAVDAIEGTGPDNIWVAGRTWSRNPSLDETYRPVIYRLSCDRPGRGSR